VQVFISQLLHRNLPLHHLPWCLSLPTDHPSPSSFVLRSFLQNKRSNSSSSSSSSVLKLSFFSSFNYFLLISYSFPLFSFCRYYLFSSHQAVAFLKHPSDKKCFYFGIIFILFWEFSYDSKSFYKVDTQIQQKENYKTIQKLLIFLLCHLFDLSQCYAP